MIGDLGKEGLGSNAKANRYQKVREETPTDRNIKQQSATKFVFQNQAHVNQEETCIRI